MFALHTTVILARVRVKPSFSQPGLLHLAGFEATQRHVSEVRVPARASRCQTGALLQKVVPLESSRNLMYFVLL